MQKSSRFLAGSIAILMTAGMAGCTLFPEQKTPTLANTTSAEQHERILWQMVQKQQWTKLAPLFGATLVWHVDGKALSREQVVPYLQSLNLKDAVLRDATIRPNGQDMIVTYTLQLAGAGGAVQEFSVFSVWQQLKGGGYILIAHSQHAPASTTTAAAR